MWPWEHLAVGYILVSVLWRVRWGRGPTMAAALAVAVGTQFPDLVDKPLAWQFNVLQSGISVAHSVFVAVPLCALVVLAARRTGHLRVGLAFAVGYLSHIPADAVYPVFYGRPVRLEAFFWPLSSAPPDHASNVLPMLIHLLTRSARLATGPEGATYVTFEVLLLGTALTLWVADGTPGLPRPANPVTR